tara:strand:+ start:144 stop:572 length:429 start_codon:yes stop_codon:yes gene_type:complete
MVKVKVVNLDGRETEYDVEYPKAYIAKIIESQNALVEEVRNVREIYADGKLIAELHGTELRLAQTKRKKTAGMGRYKGHTVPAGCDVGQYLVDDRMPNIKDKIKADEDWNEYQAEILHAQNMLKENAWVVDHTGGNIKITYN